MQKNRSKCRKILPNKFLGLDAILHFCLGFIFSFKIDVNNNFNRNDRNDYGYARHVKSL